MASYIEQTTIDVSEEDTYITPFDGYVIIGAKGADVTVKIKINGADYGLQPIVTDGTARRLDTIIPQGTILTFDNDADLMFHV